MRLPSSRVNDGICGAFPHLGSAFGWTHAMSPFFFALGPCASGAARGATVPWDPVLGSAAILGALDRCQVSQLPGDMGGVAQIAATGAMSTMVGSNASARAPRLRF